MYNSVKRINIKIHIFRIGTQIQKIRGVIVKLISNYVLEHKSRTLRTEYTKISKLENTP